MYMNGISDLKALPKIQVTTLGGFNISIDDTDISDAIIPSRKISNFMAFLICGLPR